MILTRGRELDVQLGGFSIHDPDELLHSFFVLGRVGDDPVGDARALHDGVAGKKGKPE